MSAGRAKKGAYHFQRKAHPKNKENLVKRPSLWKRARCGGRGEKKDVNDEEGS